jgi:hypothetical protein
MPDMRVGEQANLKTPEYLAFLNYFSKLLAKTKYVPYIIINE